MDIFMLVVIVIGFLLLLRYVMHGLIGKCPYCGSGNIVPDTGMFFYCNECKRKH